LHNNESSLRTVAAAAIVVVEVGTAVIATVAAVIGVVTAAVVVAVVAAVIAAVVSAFVVSAVAALDHLQFSFTEFGLLFVLPEAFCIQVHVRVVPFYLHCMRLTVARTLVRKVQDMLWHIKQAYLPAFPAGVLYRKV
jgi:hypothetical protein